MKITKTIEVDVKKSNNSFIVNDLPTLVMLMGTTAPNSNSNLYKITKKDDKYIVPISTVKNRIKMMKEKVENWQTRIKIMEQFIRGR